MRGLECHEERWSGMKSAKVSGRGLEG
jgi:hypothetical protein